MEEMLKTQKLKYTEPNVDLLEIFKEIVEMNKRCMTQLERLARPTVFISDDELINKER